MLTIKDIRRKEEVWDYDDYSIALRSEQVQGEGSFELFVHGFVQGEVEDTPGFTITAPCDVVERFGLGVFLELEDIIQTCIRGYYIEEYGKAVKEGEYRNAKREVEPYRDADNRELPAPLATQNGLGS